MGCRAVEAIMFTIQRDGTIIHVGNARDGRAKKIFSARNRKDARRDVARECAKYSRRAAYRDLRNGE